MFTSKHVRLFSAGSGYFGVLLACLLTNGCGTMDSHLYEPYPVSRQDQAGSVHVAVLNVARWEDVAGQLEANFPMDENTALSNSIPTTLLEQQQFINAMAVTLKAAFPTASYNNSSQTVTSTGSPASQTTTNSSQSASGDASSITTANPYSASTTPYGFPSGSIGEDPLLVRRNALTLLQSVRLMNRSIKDAALRRGWGYTAYVVTLQVTLMPYAHNEPYDAYSTISFFPPLPSAGSALHPLLELQLPGQAATNNPPAASTPASTRKNNYDPSDTVSDGAQGKTKPEGSPQGQKPASPAHSATNSNTAATASTTNACPATCTNAPGEGLPVVIPLLVTDDLEAAGEQRSANFIRQFTIAAAAMIHGVSVNGELDNLNQSLESVLGNDLNSLLTVGRVSDNTLQVRLGAMLQATSRYAMVAQTHNISLLLLVPERTVSATLVSKTILRNASTGIELRSRTHSEIESAVSDVVRRYVGWPGIDHLCLPGESKQFESLMAAVSTGGATGYSNFTNAVSAIASNNPACSVLTNYNDALWTDLTSIFVGSQYASTEICFDKGLEMTLPPTNQTVLAVDDGKSTTVSLSGGANLNADRLTGSLIVSNSDPKMTWTGYSTTINTGSSGRQLQMTFPSLQATGLNFGATNADGGSSADKSGAATLLTNVTVTLKISVTKVSDRAPCCASTNTYSTGWYILNTKAGETPSPQANLTLDVPTERILADQNGFGQVGVLVSLVGTNASTNVVNYVVQIHGAGSTNALPISGAFKAGAKPPATQNVLLNLNNLSEVSPVTFTLTTQDGKTNGTPVVRYVERLLLHHDR